MDDEQRKKMVHESMATDGYLLPRNYTSRLVICKDSIVLNGWWEDVGVVY